MSRVEGMSIALVLRIHFLLQWGRAFTCTKRKVEFRFGRSARKILKKPGGKNLKL